MTTPFRDPRLLALAFGLLAASVPASAQPAAGMIRGRVDVRRVAATIERRPTVTDLGMHAAHEAADRRRAVVYLESAPALAFPDNDAQLRATLDQKNETFVPHLLAITVGTIVDFPNSDSVYHNVFSLSPARRFDLGRYAAGRTRAVRFDRAGIVRVFCEIHAHMSAFILVFNHRYFSVTTADGRYQINRVPPGRYTLVAWNEGSVRETRPVVVGDDGAPVEADFVLR